MSIEDRFISCLNFDDQHHIDSFDFFVKNADQYIDFVYNNLISFIECDDPDLIFKSMILFTKVFISSSEDTKDRFEDKILNLFQIFTLPRAVIKFKTFIKYYAKNDFSPHILLEIFQRNPTVDAFVLLVLKLKVLVSVSRIYLFQYDLLKDLRRFLFSIPVEDFFNIGEYEAYEVLRCLLRYLNDANEELIDYVKVILSHMLHKQNLSHLRNKTCVFLIDHFRSYLSDDIIEKVFRSELFKFLRYKIYIVAKVVSISPEAAYLRLWSIDFDFSTPSEKYLTVYSEYLFECFLKFDYTTEHFDEICSYFFELKYMPECMYEYFVPSCIIYGEVKIGQNVLHNVLDRVNFYYDKGDAENFLFWGLAAFKEYENLDDVSIQKVYNEFLDCFSAFFVSFYSDITEERSEKINSAIYSLIVDVLYYVIQIYKSFKQFPLINDEIVEKLYFFFASSGNHDLSLYHSYVYSVFYVDFRLGNPLNILFDDLKYVYLNADPNYNDEFSHYEIFYKAFETVFSVYSMDIDQSRSFLQQMSDIIDFIKDFRTENTDTEDDSIENLFDTSVDIYIISVIGYYLIKGTKEVVPICWGLQRLLDDMINEEWFSYVGDLQVEILRKFLEDNKDLLSNTFIDEDTTRCISEDGRFSICGIDYQPGTSLLEFIAKIFFTTLDIKDDEERVVKESVDVISKILQPYYVKSKTP